MNAEQFAEQFNNHGLHPYHSPDTMVFCPLGMTEMEIRIAIHCLIFGGFKRARVEGDVVRLEKITTEQQMLNQTV